MLIYHARKLMLYFLMVFHVRVTRSKGGTEAQQRLRVAKEEVANGSASSDQEERVTRRQDGHARGAELRGDKSFK